jgi:hypothetical protein
MSRASLGRRLAYAIGLAALAFAVFWASRAEAAAALLTLSIDTAGPIVDDPKVDGRMTISGGGARRVSSRIAIEVRGQASQRFPKKQFVLETRDAAGDGRDLSLLGLPEEDDWILYAS